MAGKGRRAASRQAQLNRKRKKTQKGPSGIPSTAQRVADHEIDEPVAVLAGVEDPELRRRIWRKARHGLAYRER